MQNAGLPEVETFDDETGSMPELEAVEEAQVVHEDSMVRTTERLRLVFRGSIAQSSSEPPLPSSFRWSSTHGAIASITYSDAQFPIATALSSADAVIYALSQSMGQAPMVGIAEETQ